VLRGWGEELLRRDNVDKRKRKKEAYSPQVHPQVLTHRSNYSREEKPTGVGASDTQRDDLCGQLHLVYPGRYNYSCGSVPVGLYLWRVRLI
jgi:hypothetical protein